ncbi:kinase-like domain-containing protein [Syncephalis fuscata]|nr:kinase-like domain-containing protein [Syncephalis fuscata]
MPSSRQTFAVPGSFLFLPQDKRRAYNSHHEQDTKRQLLTTTALLAKGASNVDDTPKHHHISNVPLEQNYKLLTEIGKGAFGKVYRGIHLATKDEVAIKVIEHKNLKTARQRRNVEREVRIMSLLHHPNIIPVREVIIVPGRYTVVMNQARGGELFEHISKSRRLSESSSRRYFRQIVSALHYCHEHSIIHRDLKPENILLDETRKRAFIIDFGFSNTYRADGVINTFCGSPSYASPEMLRGVPYIGPEVDIWSLGVILYVMLTGNLPFSAKEGKQLCAQVSLGQFRIPDYVSASAADLLRRMLNVDSYKRATMQEIINHTWTMEGYSHPVTRIHKNRPCLVTDPNEESIQQLVSYGYKREDIIKYLRDTRIVSHPIISLYHLCEDGRLRREIAARRTELEKKKLIYHGRRSYSLVGQSNFFNTSIEGTVPIEQYDPTCHMPSPLAIEDYLARATDKSISGQLAVKRQSTAPAKMPHTVADTIADMTVCGLCHNVDGDCDCFVVESTSGSTHPRISEEDRERFYTPELPPADDSGCASSAGRASNHSALLALESIKDGHSLPNKSVSLIHDYCRASSGMASPTDATFGSEIESAQYLPQKEYRARFRNILNRKTAVTTTTTPRLGSSASSIVNANRLPATVQTNPPLYDSHKFTWKKNAQHSNGTNVRQFMGQCQLLVVYRKLYRKMARCVRRKRSCNSATPDSYVSAPPIAPITFPHTHITAAKRKAV